MEHDPVLAAQPLVARIRRLALLAALVVRRAGGARRRGQPGSPGIDRPWRAAGVERAGLSTGEAAGLAGGLTLGG